MPCHARGRPGTAGTGTGPLPHATHPRKVLHTSGQLSYAFHH